MNTNITTHDLFDPMFDMEYELGYSDPRCHKELECINTEIISCEQESIARVRSAGPCYWQDGSRWFARTDYNLSYYGAEAPDPEVVALIDERFWAGFPDACIRSSYMSIYDWNEREWEDDDYDDEEYDEEEEEDEKWTYRYGTLYLSEYYDRKVKTIKVNFDETSEEAFAAIVETIRKWHYTGLFEPEMEYTTDEHNNYYCCIGNGTTTINIENMKG